VPKGTRRGAKRHASSAGGSQDRDLFLPIHYPMASSIASSSVLASYRSGVAKPLVHQVAEEIDTGKGEPSLLRIAQAPHGSRHIGKGQHLKALSREVIE
jgi:hypothetical protein